MAEATAGQTSWKDVLGGAFEFGVEYLEADNVREHELEMAELAHFGGNSQQRTDEITGQQIPSGAAVSAGFGTGNTMLNWALFLVVGVVVLKVAKVI